MFKVSINEINEKHVIEVSIEDEIVMSYECCYWEYDVNSHSIIMQDEDEATIGHIKTDIMNVSF